MYTEKEVVELKDIINMPSGSDKKQRLLAFCQTYDRTENGVVAKIGDLKKKSRIRPLKKEKTEVVSQKDAIFAQAEVVIRYMSLTVDQETQRLIFKI